MSVLLEARGLRVRRGGRTILENLNLSIGAGQFLALVGPNGAGKTTLIEAMAGILPASSGQVFLGGEDLREVDARSRSQRLALSGRERNSDLSMTALDAVLLGRLPHRTSWGYSKTDRRIAREKLASVDCSAFATRPLFSLSDGEQQRVAWARAAAQEPQVLLLDEATAHLDLKHRELCFGRASSFSKRGGAVVAVAHDLDLALRHASDVAVLYQGSLLAIGPPREVLTAELLSKVFQLDAEVVETPRGVGLVTYGTLL